jgi:hypothetical protein
MSKKIKVGFSDFWGGFDPTTDPIFGKFFRNNFNIEYNDTNPDFLIFSVDGDRHKSFNCKKILFTPENFFCHKYPPFDFETGDHNLYKYADYSITSFDIDNQNNFRMPCYVRRYGFDIIDKIRDRTIPEKSKKVLFIQKNCIPFRDNFSIKLRKYINVDSVGGCVPNLNIHVEDKLSFMKDYKFIISFENSTYKNYNTEKILDGFITKTLPLYWGDPNIKSDFNEDSFIYYNDYENEDLFIERILELDSNEEKYNNMLLTQPIKNEEIFSSVNFINFMKKIFEI